MSQARRAAVETVDVSVHSDAPRRGRTTGVGPLLSRALAPTAIVGLLVATTALTFVPMGDNETTSVADPLSAHDERTANRASREFTRSTIPTPYTAASVTLVASPSLAVAAVSPSAVATPSVVPSPSAVASVTPEAPAAPAPASSPAVAAAPAPAQETPEVDWSALGKEAGTQWVTGSVNVRSGPGTDKDVVTAFAEGRKVTVTDSTHDGWQQISLKSGAGWIKATFLTEKEPAATPASSPATKSAKKASGSVGSAGTCAKAGNAEKGMQSRTVSVLRKVCAQFPGITSYGGYRAGSSGYHGSGQAIDAMISGDAGWEVARWVRANASSLGVVEVIYAQKIWTTQRAGDGWRSMSGRGGASANHFDHVHISVR